MIHTFYGFEVVEMLSHCYDDNSYLTIKVPNGKLEYFENKEEGINKMSKLNILDNGITITMNGDYFSDLSGQISNLSSKPKVKKQKEDKIIFNDKKRTTVVLWKDGTKTIVKASDNDTFDRRVGYLMAFYHKNCGLSKTKANKYIDSLCEEEIEMIDVSKEGE